MAGAKLGVEQFPGLPGWKRSTCLGCGQPVIASRHAYIVMGGRRNGTALFVIGVKPHIMQVEDVDAFYREQLLMFGVAR